MRLIIKGAFWLGLYAFIVLFPLVVGAVFISSADAADFGIALADAFGYIGLAVMAAELALVSRVNGAAGAFGEDALLQFHREIGIAALLARPCPPRAAHGRAATRSRSSCRGAVRRGRYGWARSRSSAALLVVGVSVLRKRLGTRYESWQATHGLLAMTLVVTAVIHIGAVGRFAALPVMQVLWVVYLVAFVGLFLRYRLIRPLRAQEAAVGGRREPHRARQRPYRGLSPVGHPGFSFEPGQFGWVGFGQPPFAHVAAPDLPVVERRRPGPAERRVTFTIKKLGDWSGRRCPRSSPGARRGSTAPTACSPWTARRALATG